MWKSRTRDSFGLQDRARATGGGRPEPGLGSGEVSYKRSTGSRLRFGGEAVLLNEFRVRGTPARSLFRALIRLLGFNLLIYAKISFGKDKVLNLESSGFLVAVHTSTGVVGINGTRGRVYTGGRSPTHGLYGLTAALGWGAPTGGFTRYYLSLAECSRKSLEVLSSRQLGGGSISLIRNSACPSALECCSAGGGESLSPHLGGHVWVFRVDFPNVAQAHALSAACGDSPE